MPVSDAERFIKDIVTDEKLRDAIYEANTYDERMKAIENYGYCFQYDEFESAVTHLKTESLVEENAQILDELFTWWQLLNQDRHQAECDGTGCAPSACASCGGNCGQSW